MTAAAKAPRRADGDDDLGVGIGVRCRSRARASARSPRAAARIPSEKRIACGFRARSRRSRRRARAAASGDRRSPCPRLMPPTRSHSRVMRRMSDWTSPRARALSRLDRPALTIASTDGWPRSSNSRRGGDCSTSAPILSETVVALIGGEARNRVIRRPSCKCPASRSPCSEPDSLAIGTRGARTGRARRASRA